MNSCIYNGLVTHHRFKPIKHELKYKTFSLLIDLDELELLDTKISIFSFNKFNVFSFYNKDHGARDGSFLKEWVIENLKKFNINNQITKIKLLCYPRIFGYVFNPLSIFYCYEEENLRAIFYEVKNTFNKQQHSQPIHSSHIDPRQPHLSGYTTDANTPGSMHTITTI